MRLLSDLLQIIPDDFLGLFLFCISDSVCSKISKQEYFTSRLFELILYSKQFYLENGSLSNSQIIKYDLLEKIYFKSYDILEEECKSYDASICDFLILLLVELNQYEKALFCTPENLTNASLKCINQRHPKFIAILARLHQ